ncbi:ExbD/TolR family protein [Pantanalinema sp. GBBB05]|uniref:ExbD/TolR family protein n=1 Tax=Pantanalinema sp. GBBB05 TaxID=2604139 RepID=UPI001D1E73D3|nr:biopolymer transporter ExbD [Pantanalinema sp. GBBB05]
MKINFDTPPEDVQIQIVPLIDIIFCILTFFILAALQLTRQPSIQVDLPRASTATTQTRDTLLVSIDQAGRTFIDKQPIDRTQLTQVVQTYLERNPEGILVVNASQMAFYNDVVQVLDTLRAVGGDRVALATSTAAASSPPTPTTSPGLDPLNPLGNGASAPSLNPEQPYQFPLPTSPGPGTGNSAAPTPPSDSAQ